MVQSLKMPLEYDYQVSATTDTEIGSIISALSMLSQSPPGTSVNDEIFKAYGISFLHFPETALYG